jgi:hypothetical protein
MLLRSSVCLFLLLLPAAAVASTTPDSFPITIKVTQSETVPLQGESTYTEGCNLTDYSAACGHSSDQFVRNVMIVKDNDGKVFTITCTVESRWSNCVPLPVGDSFRARIEKNGLSVFYVGSNGHPHKQHYDVLPDEHKADLAVH